MSWTSSYTWRHIAQDQVTSLVQINNITHFYSDGWTGWIEFDLSASFTVAHIMAVTKSLWLT